MRNKHGFTLIESLIVISIIMMITLITAISLKPHAYQGLSMRILQQKILAAQCIATFKHQDVEIEVDNNELCINHHCEIIENLAVKKANFHFNSNGHISKALSIYSIDNKYRLIFQLGSGLSDLR